MDFVAKLPSALLVAAALSLACGDARSPEPVKVAASGAGDPAAAATDGPVASTGAPKIVSDAPEHDFGPIALTDAVEHVFKIRNAGDAELKIDRVQRT